MTNQAIPLAEAAFCETCQMFVNSLRVCFKCDNGTHLVPMSGIMDPVRSEVVACVGIYRDVMRERVA